MIDVILGATFWIAFCLASLAFAYLIFVVAYVCIVPVKRPGIPKGVDDE